jgi:hypothetical protein
MANATVSRAAIGSSCEVELSGSRYQCRLDSMSSAGARVICLGFLRETLRGDRALLHLPAAGDIPCRVADIAAAKIKLRFENS